MDDSMRIVDTHVTKRDHTWARADFMRPGLQCTTCKLLYTEAAATGQHNCEPRDATA